MDISKLTIPHVLHHWATHQPDTAAFIFRDSHRRRRVLTRADVYRLASRFAAILRRHDVRRGDLVCNTLPNSPERVVSDLGVILAGAVAVNGQILLADGEDFIGSLQDSCCVAVILDPLELSGAKRLLNLLEQEVKDDGKVHFPKLPALRMIYECTWEGHGQQVSFMDTLEREIGSYVADVTPDDLAYVFNTSGSTGFSKLVPRSHAQIFLLAQIFYCVVGLPYMNSFATNDNSPMARFEHANDRSDEDIPLAPNSGANIQQQSEASQFESTKCTSDRSGANSTSPGHSPYVFFSNGRLGWSGGVPSGFLLYGATRVLLDLSRGCPDDLVAGSWMLVCEERCQYAYMLPFHLQQLVSRKDLWQRFGFRLEVLCLAGQPIYNTLLKEVTGSVCDSINLCYAASEFGVLTAKWSVNPDLYKDGNNGKPVPGVEVKVVDENLQEIPPGGEVIGEVLVRTPTALKYYIGNAEAAQKMLLPDGWCRTGDVGYLDKEGDLFVLCRTSYGIIRGAYVIYPGWLESRIKSHPAVRDVMVVPVPDPVLHQEICACVMTKSEVTADDLRQFCEDMFLTGREDHMTAVPRYFLFFSDFPATATGKPCRRSTTAAAKARLFGEDSAI